MLCNIIGIPMLSISSITVLQSITEHVASCGMPVTLLVVSLTTYYSKYGVGVT